jgi:hypothetical protein
MPKWLMLWSRARVMLIVSLFGGPKIIFELFMRPKLAKPEYERMMEDLYMLFDENHPWPSFFATIERAVGPW